MFGDASIIVLCKCVMIMFVLQGCERDTWGRAYVPSSVLAGLGLHSELWGWPGIAALHGPPSLGDRAEVEQPVSCCRGSLHSSLLPVKQHWLGRSAAGQCGCHHNGAAVPSMALCLAGPAEYVTFTVDYDWENASFEDGQAKYNPHWPSIPYSGEMMDSQSVPCCSPMLHAVHPPVPHTAAGLQYGGEGQLDIMW